MEGTPTIKSHRKLLQIIDTTLLQCYLHVSVQGLSIPHSQKIQHNVSLGLYFYACVRQSVYAHESR